MPYLSQCAHVPCIYVHQDMSKVNCRNHTLNTNFVWRDRDSLAFQKAVKLQKLRKIDKDEKVKLKS
jgi:hypothetical protein